MVVEIKRTEAIKITIKDVTVHGKTYFNAYSLNG